MRFAMTELILTARRTDLRKEKSIRRDAGILKHHAHQSHGTDAQHTQKARAGDQYTAAMLIQAQIAIFGGFWAAAPEGTGGDASPVQ